MHCERQEGSRYGITELHPASPEYCHSDEPRKKRLSPRQSQVPDNTIPGQSQTAIDTLGGEERRSAYPHNALVYFWHSASAQRLTLQR